MGVNSANKGYIGDFDYDNIVGTNNSRNSYLLQRDLEQTINPYVRPSGWVDLPGVTAGEQKIVGTYAVYDNDSNFLAINISGNYTVDWGDGTTGSFSAASTAEKIYTRTTYAGLTSSVVRGYKTLNVTITPQAGQNLTAVDLVRGHSSRTAGTGYSTQWLDINFSAPNLTSFSFYTDIAPATMLERFNWLNTSTTYSFSYANLFRNCVSLKSIPAIPRSTHFNCGGMFILCESLETIPWFDTRSHSDMNSMFAYCYNLKTIPPLNTSNVTDISFMFDFCYSISSLPSLDTGKVTLMVCTFRGCQSLTYLPYINTSNVTNFQDCFRNSYIRTIPPLITSKATNFVRMFYGCVYLQEIPLLDTSSATSVASMFESCASLKTIPKLNTSNSTSFAFMFYNCYSLETVPLLDTSKGTDFSYMFMFDYSLEDVPQFDLSKGTNFESMFRLCSSLKYLPDFNTILGQNFNLMFAQTNLFIAPGLSFGGPGTTYATNAFQQMFLNTSTLTEIPTYNFSGVSSGSGFASIYSSMLSGVDNLSRAGITGIQHNITLGSYKLSGTALNEIYSSLAVVGASGSGTKTITVSGNWGTATDNPGIAIAKGWTVTG